jgi:hypothetical protein
LRQARLRLISVGHLHPSEWTAATEEYTGGNLAVTKDTAGLYGPNQGAGFIASVIGAIIVRFVYHSVRKRRA